MKAFSCGAVVPGCDARFEGDTIEEILIQVGAHAREDHGMTDVPDEVVEQVKQHIVEVPA